MTPNKKKNLFSQPADKLLEGFPYWERLHGLWQTMPNFNPVTITSSHGQNLSNRAESLRQGKGKGREVSPLSHESEPEDPMDVDNHGLPTLDLDNPSQPPPPPTPPLPEFSRLLSFHNDSPPTNSLVLRSRSISRGRAASRSSHRFSPFTNRSDRLTPFRSATPSTPLTSMTPPTPLTPSFDDEVDSSNFMAKRMDRMIAAESTKLRRYEAKQMASEVDVERERSRQKLIEANIEKERLKQRERITAMHHTREREKELHQLKLLEMQLRLAEAKTKTTVPSSLPSLPVSQPAQFDFNQFDFNANPLDDLGPPNDLSPLDDFGDLGPLNNMGPLDNFGALAGLGDFEGFHGSFHDAS